MKIYAVVIYDPVTHEHRPALLGGEAISPQAVPLSSYPGNKLKAHDDGLYYGGNSVPPLLYIDAVNGVDGNIDAHGGSSVLKTLDFALSLIETYQPEEVTLLLKCGQTFPLTAVRRKLVNTKLTLSYYGDPKYPIADTPYSTSKIAPQLFADLERPIISSTSFQAASGYWGMNHIDLTGGSVTLKGVRVEVPSSPANQVGLTVDSYAAASDMFVLGDADITTDGVIVNKNDKTSVYGLFAVKSRTRVRYSEFGTQFRIADLCAGLDGAGQDAASLAARGYFIKFYPDRPTSNSFIDYPSLVATAVGTTGGCGLLTLMYLLCSHWDDVVSGSHSLQTWPLADYTYGISRYIYGIRRDQQSRPLNITSSILL